MFTVECTKCDVTANGMYATDEGWVAVARTKGPGRDWLCPDHAPEVPEQVAEETPPPLGKPAEIIDLKARFAAHLRERPVEVPQGGNVTARVENVTASTGRHPLQEQFGFTHPEAGSGERYQVRRQVVPWLQHSVWWFVHNAIAHPLIAVLPVRRAFQFHDWTSYKMHGK